MIIREWKPSKWAEWVITALLSPIWLPVIGLWLAEEFLKKTKRRFVGPRVGEWQRWFAWHPVALDGGWGETVWLEVVERTSIGTSYNWGIVYRHPKTQGLQNED